MNFDQCNFSLSNNCIKEFLLEIKFIVPCNIPYFSFFPFSKLKKFWLADLALSLLQAFSKNHLIHFRILFFGN